MIHRALVRQLILASVLLSLPGLGSAQNALKVINPPSGGRVIYGQVPGETTESGAMGWILRSLHKEFGDRPQPGKLFQVRGTESVAAFFSLTNHYQHNAPLTGLMIVAKTSTDNVEGAVVYDEAAKFNSNYKSLTKALFNAWHPFEGAREAKGKSSGGGGTIPPMHRFVTQDRSVSVDLPESWKADPGSAGGTLTASGPNGEVLGLGVTILGYDTRNPSVQRTMQTVQQGGLRGTAYANGFYHSAGDDMSQMFIAVVQFMRHKKNLPPATFQMEDASPLQTGGAQRSAHLTGQLDPQDGKGKREFNAILTVSRPEQFGTYLATIYYTTVPVAQADKERAMLGAILASFQQDTAIIQQQANAYAAPAIAQIHEIGKRAAIQAKSAQEANAIHNSSVYQRWDDQDKRSKEFENYQLGYSVVHDIPNNAHGTFWNQDADALVKSDPQRFEYVNAPNFWKGIDY